MPSEAVLSNNTQSNHDNSWIIDLNSHCNHQEDIDMEIDSDIVTVVTNHDLDSNNYDTMDIEQDTDVNLLLKRAIGAERRQKSATETLLPIDSQEYSESTTNNHSLPPGSSSFEETEQFFHDLCAELTSTTAALVSSSSSSANVLRCSTQAEQTVIH